MKFKNPESVGNQISNEHESRENEKSELGTLSGFVNLSTDQQRHILASLYVQERAERKTDPSSASRVQKMPTEFEEASPGRAYITWQNSSEQSAPKYFQSQLRIMSENCFQAVVNLEERRKGGLLPRDYLEAGPIRTYEELLSLIALTEEVSNPPLVLETRSDQVGLKSPLPIHATILLGQNKDGELMVWEKACYNMPFQILPLNQVYKAYSKYSNWRIRQLSV